MKIFKFLLDKQYTVLNIEVNYCKNFINAYQMIISLLYIVNSCFLLQMLDHFQWAFDNFCNYGVCVNIILLLFK